MSVIRVQKEERYTIIDNYPLEDRKLSWGAKGLLVYLLHLPNNWEVKVEHLKNQSKDGRDATNAKIKELRKAGYIKRDDKIQKDKGKYDGYNYIVCENPLPEKDRDIVKEKKRKEKENTGKPLRQIRNGESVTENPELLRTILQSTNKERLTDKSGNLSKFKPTLDENTKELFNLIIPIAGFPHSTDKESKLLIKAMNFINSLVAVQLSDYKLNDEWMKKNKIEVPKVETYQQLLPILKKACSRFATMKMEGYWPPDKSKLPKSIDDFFYNPRTQKSWMLYCYYHRPEERKEQAANEIKEKVKAEMTSEDMIAAEKYLPSNWNESIYWKKIRELNEWIKIYGDALHTYNDGGVARLNHLLDYYKEFQSTWESWGINNFGRGNATWNIFIKWMRDRQIDLEPDKKELIRKCEDVSPDYFNDGNKEWQKIKGMME
jgi:hypothetical protein